MSNKQKTLIAFLIFVLLGVITAAVLPVAFGGKHDSKKLPNKANMMSTAPSEGENKVAAAKAFEKEKKQTEELLLRLSSYEDRVLKEHASGKKSANLAGSPNVQGSNQAGTVPANGPPVASSQSDVTGPTSKTAEVTPSGGGQDAGRKALELENENLRRETSRLNSDLVMIRTDLENAKQAVAELTALRKDAAEKDEELVSLKRQLSKSFEDSKSCEVQVGAAKDLLVLQSENSQLKQQLTVKEQENLLCRSQLEGGSDLALKVQQLEKELVIARNELLQKDALLNKTPQQRTTAPKIPQQPRTWRERMAMARNAQQAARLQQAVPSGQIVPPLQHTASFQPAAPTATAAQSLDVMVVEVKAPKVNLRSGPGNENSPVMQIDQGSRLTVEAREGDWFRVVTPTGGRAFVRRDVVNIIEGGRGVEPPVSEPAVPSAIPPPRTAGAQSEGSNTMVSFGEVQIGGRTEPTRNDIEAVAFEKLKSLGKSENKEGESTAKPE